jgi:hypothetical protein
MSFVSLILAFLLCAEAQPGTMSGVVVSPNPGICPNYYGPYEPNPIGQPEYCENMMQPGTYKPIGNEGKYKICTDL